MKYIKSNHARAGRKYMYIYIYIANRQTQPQFCNHENRIEVYEKNESFVGFFEMHHHIYIFIDCSCRKKKQEAACEF